MGSTKGRQWVRIATAVTTVLVAVPGVVAAHDPPDNRFGTPIPLSLLFAGAAATVGATAISLAVLDPDDGPWNGRQVAVLPDPLARWGPVATRVGFLALFCLTLVAGILGPVAGERNVGTVFFWAVWLKGMAILAAVVGDPWPVLSPWASIHRGIARISGDDAGLVGEYPTWLGHWPALVGFVAVAGLVENTSAIPDSAPTTAALLGGYAVAMVAGGLAFGPEWFRRGDFFAVLYRLVGCVAPLRVVENGIAGGGGGYGVRLRPPWTGATRPTRGIATAAFVVALVYTVSFDGFAETIQYEYLLVSVGLAFGTGVDVDALTYVVGYAAFLAGLVAVVAATDLLGGGSTGSTVDPVDTDGGRPVEGDGNGDPGPGIAGTLNGLAPTLLPIAVAYEVAHTYAYVITSAGLVVGVGDPLRWLPLPAFWGTQVVLITLGHVVAVVAAHHVTRRRYGTPAAARRGHVPMTLLMVAYTVLSLWIVSLPVVK